MQMGIEWNEDLPYSDPRNGEIAMEYAKDRYQFVLKQKIISQPGKKWHHNGGPTALIVRLIAKGTGKNIDPYAAEKLFNPLGITNFEWAAGGDGEPSAASGLRLNIRDLAKTGQLVSNGGRYNGQQIILCSLQYVDDVKKTLDYVKDKRIETHIQWLNPGYSDDGMYFDRLGVEPQPLADGVTLAIRNGKINTENRIQEIRERILGWAHLRNLISTQ